MEISIIISNFNNGKFISRAIRSAINQNFDKREFEILVIDDCSTDNSINLIEGFGNYIRTIYNKTNLGLAISCNNAVKAALGKFVFFLDSDDIISSNVLLVEHDFLSHNKESIDAVSCDYYEISEKETILKRRDGMAYPIRCGIMYYTDHLMELGPYDPNVPREDIDFRRRFLQNKKFIYNISIPYYKYTQHNNSITKTILEPK